MSEIVGVNITVVGLEINGNFKRDDLICQFYEEEKLISSIIMSEEYIWNWFNYSESFEYAKVQIRPTDGYDSIGEVKLGLSFLNKLTPDIPIEQWLSLQTSSNKTLSAKDFIKEYDKQSCPAIWLRFDAILATGKSQNGKSKK